MQIFQGPKSHIHPIARALLAQDDNFILCRVKDAKWFFLPGGHIEDGESAEKALLRELHEEIGNGDYKVSSFVGVCENIFELKEGVLQHEINIIFKVDVPSTLNIDTREKHIEFISVPKDDIENYKILPTSIKDGLIEWLKDGRPFLKGI